MKKTTWLFGAALVFAASLGLSACKQNAGDDGDASDVEGRRFYFYSEETEDDKPEESSSGSDSGSDDSSGTDDGSSSTPQDYKEDITVPWIYFQDEENVVVGTIGFTVYYDGSTGEEKNRVKGTPYKKYYGTYKLVTSSNEDVQTLNLIYNVLEETNSMTPTIIGLTNRTSAQDIEKGFELTSNESKVSSKNYEFGIDDGDLIIKYTEDKGSYKEWTTYTWKELDIEEDKLKVDSSVATGVDADFVEGTYKALKHYGSTYAEDADLKISKGDCLVTDSNGKKLYVVNNTLYTIYTYYHDAVSKSKYLEDQNMLSGLTENTKNTKISVLYITDSGTEYVYYPKSQSAVIDAIIKGDSEASYSIGDEAYFTTLSGIAKGGLSSTPSEGDTTEVVTEDNPYPEDID